MLPLSVACILFDHTLDEWRFDEEAHQKHNAKKYFMVTEQQKILFQPHCDDFTEFFIENLT
jgi:hypothetical protein